MSASGEAPISEVIYYSDPVDGDGYLYRQYPPTSEGFDSVGGAEAQEWIRRADVWAQPIQIRTSRGFRVQVNPDQWPNDEDRPDPQEIMDDSGGKYEALARTVEQTLGRTGLIILVSGGVPFQAPWR